jgi:hypothetical protein
MARKLALLVICVVLGGACGKAGESQSESAASVPAMIPSPPPVEGELPRLSAWAERLQGATRVAGYGRLDEADLDYVVGEVAAVETDRVGNVLVLDEKYHDLKVFSEEGEHLFTVGGAGRGPGEFVAPSTMDWLSPDTLIVTDGTRRGQLFERQSDGNLAFRATFPTSVGVEASCVQNGGFWVHGFGPDMVRRVHQVDPSEGQLSNSLAPVVPIENAILQRRRALGFMACSDTYDLVAITSRYFPDVQVFGLDGEENWAASVPDFTPMEFTLVEGGGLRQGIARDAGGFHWIVGVTLLDPSTLVVQVGWQTAESSAAGLDYTELSTHLFSIHTGASLRIEKGVPLIRKALPDGFLASEQDPFPRALRYRFAPEGT